MTQTEKKALASRFSFEDWTRLCGNGNFLIALRSGIDEAQAVAWTLISKWNGIN